MYYTFMLMNSVTPPSLWAPQPPPPPPKDAKASLGCSKHENVRTLCCTSICGKGACAASWSCLVEAIAV